MIRDFEQWAPRVDSSAYVDPQATVIGRVQIGSGSSVWPRAVVRGDIHHIKIGSRTNIQDGCVLHVTHASVYVTEGRPLIIGDDVTVGHGVTLHACTVETGCLVGMGGIVLDGAVLESGAMLGAGSLVVPGKRLEGGYLWLGSPVRRVRVLTESEREYILYSARHYARLAERYKSQLSS